jgi:hypothetical protein
LTFAFSDVGRSRLSEISLFSKAYSSQKLSSCLDFIFAPDTALTITKACILSEATDFLSQVVQSTDENGHSIHELIAKGGSAEAVQRHLYTLCQAPPERSESHYERVLPLLGRYFGNLEGIYMDYLSDALHISSQASSHLLLRHTVCSTNAPPIHVTWTSEALFAHAECSGSTCVCVCVLVQVWARIDVPFNAFPWRLFALHAADRSVVLDSLYSAHACCLDQPFSEPLRARFQRSQWDDSTTIGESLRHAPALSCNVFRRTCAQESSGSSIHIAPQCFREWFA